MNENIKLNEAKYFLEEMKLKKMDRQAFEHNLSAFLTASRTIFQYALEECKRKSGGQTWYDLKIASNIIVKYLKDKRNLNIHHEPVKPLAHFSVNSVFTMSLSGSATVTDKDGNIISKTEFGNPNPSENSNKTTTDVVYKFDDWNGSEDVIQLCENYLSEIESFITEGISNDFITGI